MEGLLSTGLPRLVLCYPAHPSTTRHRWTRSFHVRPYLDSRKTPPHLLFGSHQTEELVNKGEILVGLWPTMNSSLRQFGLTTDFLSYRVGFLIHSSPYFQNCFCLPICRNRNHVCKILTVRNPL